VNFTHQICETSPRNFVQQGVRTALAAALASLLLLSPISEGAHAHDSIAAQNAEIALEGPVPGIIAEDLPAFLVPERAMAPALEGGNTGREEDAGEDLNLNNMVLNDKIDIPTGAKPSPLFGATAFDQQMLRFEEFGPVPLGAEESVLPGPDFPSPLDAESGPSASDLDGFLNQFVTPSLALPHPFPTREANDPDNGGSQENPWKPQIESFLGRPLETPPAEGRPPGEDWAHQRFTEFFPESYINTFQGLARENGGARDALQFHQYDAGEWAPGKLYHNTAGIPETAGTTAGIPVQFHRNFPAQDPLALWTWDGTFPPKLMSVRYGEPVLMRHYNALPIDPAANFGFGLHTLSTHEHNGHNPAESDGFTQAFFFPGQFYDYRWPMVLAGHDTFPAGDPRASTPTGNPRAGSSPDLGNRNIRGDWRETMSTHWFHDHMLDFTAQNVYKGSAAMMNYYSSIDRGNEAVEDGVNLRLPSGTALNWGNRDYDINLMIADKAWDADGQLFFNIFNPDGFMGDQLLTNWGWKPYFDVRARRYRFRILNGSVSRYLRIALVEKVDGSGGELSGPPGSNISYNRVPFHMVANDGNIMEHAVAFDGQSSVAGFENRKGILPSQAIAERYDIVVDFAQFAPGTKLYMVNLLEHRDGKRPKVEVPLAAVLSGFYHERNSQPADVPYIGSAGYRTDPAVSRFLELRVHAYTGTDQSMDPANFVAGKQTMIPLPSFSQEEVDNAIHRSFDFGRSSGTDEEPFTIKTSGGTGLGADPRRLSASTTKSSAEIWHLTSSSEGYSHPIHIHFEEGQILRRGGKAPPEWEKWARKDVYRLGRLDDSGLSLDVILRFREFLGTFMEHCHNTQHEDHSMLLRWDIEKPGQVRVMPTPLPTWDGVGYVPSFALPTFRTGDPGGAGINGYTSAPINIPDPSGLLMLSNGTPFRTFLSTRHEDHAALLRWDIENPGPILMPDPPPSTDDGVGQVASTGGSPAVPEGSVEVAVNVPEPSTLLTLSSGAALLAFLAARRRRDRG
jgi:FtsP/CotA-like multicopper oxidase with cupredoxin domain